jgi:hypothetical protein
MFINRTDFLADQAAHQTVVPGRVKPGGELPLPFVVK